MSEEVGMPHLISVGDKHHVPRQEILGDHGDGVLFTMETADGATVVTCFVTHEAIRALQGSLDGNIMHLFTERRLIFEQIASTVYSESKDDPVVIEEATVAHLARVLR
jgi:hypothetical protein